MSRSSHVHRTSLGRELPSRKRKLQRSLKFLSAGWCWYSPVFDEFHLVMVSTLPSGLHLTRENRESSARLCCTESFSTWAVKPSELSASDPLTLTTLLRWTERRVWEDGERERGRVSPALLGWMTPGEWGTGHHPPEHDKWVLVRRSFFSVIIFIGGEILLLCEDVSDWLPHLVTSLLYLHRALLTSWPQSSTEVHRGATSRLAGGQPG